MKPRTYLYHRLIWLLPVVIYAASMLHVYRPDRSSHREEIATLRFAHWNLQAGRREGFTELIRRYEALNPGVRIEQTIVPVRVWYPWQQTQLVGGTPPDIFELGRISDDEMIVQNFVPLGDAVARPNPYNEGSPLAGMPWRNTFLDGLRSLDVYYPALQEVYGVPTLQMNMSMFYNRDLLKAITGSSVPPQNYRDYLKLSQKVAAYRQRVERPIVPIAGASDYGTYLMGKAMQRLTQKQREKIDSLHVLTAPQSQVGMAYLRGEWSLQDPEIQSGFRIFKTMGRDMQPGFLQLKRDDATLLFTQQNALMLISGSWDYYLLSKDCPFPIVVGPLPLPDPEDPEFGDYTAGIAHEGEQALNGIYGITRASKHQAQALDFLRYLTSYDGSRFYTEFTHTLSATLEVPITDQNLLAFARNTTGPVNGFLIGVGPESARWFSINAFRLFQAGESTEQFTRETADAYRKAIIRDLEKIRKNQLKTNLRTDSTLIAEIFRPTPQPSNAESLLAGQIARELEIMQLQATLDQKAD